MHSSPFRPGSRRALALAAIALPVLALAPVGCGGGGDAAPPRIGLVDSDGDQLTDRQEIAGWRIKYDRTGNGMDDDSAQWEDVTADPSKRDTDGDGLTDFEECKLRTHPREVDTDLDGLSDFEEVTQWHTNPITVDSDGDARGPGRDRTPRSVLFDWSEIHRLKTSPSLADTDGDSRTDYQEVDDDKRSPVIAELPTVELEVDGEMDVRLNVEYAEAIGKSTEYGTSFSTSTSNTERSSTTQTHTAGGSITLGYEKSVEVGFTDASVSTTLSAEFTASYDFSHEETVEQESSVELTSESSKYQTDSREMTETSATGAISIPMRLKNTGDQTFTLKSLGMSVLHWTPGATPHTGKFRVMGTITAQRQNVTLSPGERTSRLEVSNTEVDASVIKQFLARPSSLVLEPAIFDLTNVDDIDFDFLTETTYKRTALVEIDLGKTVERYRVATNVERTASGGWAGVRMGVVMNDILGIKRGDRDNGYTVAERKGTDPKTKRPIPPGVFSLESVRGRYPEPGPTSKRFGAIWAMIGNRAEHSDVFTSFDDIRLHGGDEVRLVFVQDRDADGLYDFEETSYGTSDLAKDSDGDGIDDADEIRKGWEVRITELNTNRLLRSYRVHSDPRFADADGDGVDDGEEMRVLGTDPRDPDTDDDGLRDGDDRDLPTTPAFQLHVRKGGPGTGQDRGRSWIDAYPNVDVALGEAKRLNTATPGSVSEIWVARGDYTPPSSGFTLDTKVMVYGGFDGNEITLGGRDSDPRTNGTALMPGSAIRIVNVLRATRAAGLDGFTIARGTTGLVCFGSPTLRNLLFFENKHSAIAVATAPRKGPHPLLQDVAFVGNEAPNGGGIVVDRGDLITDVADVTLQRCAFFGNRAVGLLKNEDGRGGAILFDANGVLTITDSVFRDNSAFVRGGAIALAQPRIRSREQHLGSAEITNCEFDGNKVTGEDKNRTNAGDGGAINRDSADGFLAITNTRFYGNQAQGSGAVIAGTLATPGTGHLTMTNCTVAKNHSFGNNSNNQAPGGIGVSSRLLLSNCILWGNTAAVPSATGGHGDQISIAWTQAPERVYHSCVQKLSGFRQGFGNIDKDPGFAGLSAGNLHLGKTSPCIDAGLNFVDTNVLKKGIQPLPAVDLDGSRRIADGNGDKREIVDMGSYEVQGG